MTDKNKRILIGKIGAAHGVKGHVRLLILSGDPALLSYCKDFYISEEGGQMLEIYPIRVSDRACIVRIEGISDRTQAETLRGMSLYVHRSAFPDLPQDTYYHADLTGLRVIDTKGAFVGSVIGVENFGAGDLLEIRAEEGESFYLPFTNENVPCVDIVSGVLTVDLPDGIR